MSEKNNFIECDENVAVTEWYTPKLDKFTVRASKAIFDSIDWGKTEIVHFPWKKDSRFLMRWMNEKLQQLIDDWELSIEDGISIRFDDEPYNSWYLICQLNWSVSLFDNDKLKEQYWENGNFWDASHYDGRSEWKHRVGYKRYAICNI